jgi:hypothetical protein
MAYCHYHLEMDACRIIEALGGRDAVARATGVKVSTVISWEWRGFFPARRLPAVFRLIERLPKCGVTKPQVLSLVENPIPRVPKQAA